MTRRVLLIAYHFPPVQGSSGVLRTLSFARHLRELGWEPLVLSAQPRAYPATSPQQLADIPGDMVVNRAFALDTARHLAWRGIYPGILAAPDRWWTWWPGGLVAGMRMIRRWRPQVIWSTAPIATAHLIGMSLRRLSGLPWVADIRDLLTEPGEPAHPVAWRATRWIERHTLRGSDRVVVVSPGQKTEYQRQFPELADSQMTVIPNGFEESYFEDAERLGPPERPTDRLLLVHSGVLYPDGRNPETFLTALAQAISAGAIGRAELEVRLRASGSEALYAEMIERLGLQDIVQLLPGLDYRSALAEMLHADGLLLFQGAGTETAIPAKLYEYFRARRPILAFTEPASATADALQQAGFTRMASLESAEAIEKALREFVAELRQGEGHRLDARTVAEYSRRQNAHRLAGILNELST